MGGLCGGHVGEFISRVVYQETKPKIVEIW
jgi:hypothetical protein